MLTSARACTALVTIALGALLFTGCKKEEEAPQAVPLPSAAPAPVKATEDTPQAAQGSAAGSAAPAEVAPSAAPAPTEPPKAVAAPSIDGCCSALQALSKDAKSSSTVRSKAATAASMCAGTAKLVKEGKAPRSTALTQIRATMAGSAPAACN
ncbi:hypothetical protein [Polyangium fumosum]|uniref:Uncharacterized protein n=1 Tax=Polyangium fumosum TaxID=889272 RepID=A0A4U1ISQ9_9BACT|nr:hypothetical protein [Polyangium fumosum]TKC97050.1 hypothetical protein E8A74_44925 [Polyangium fumosum]